MINAFKIESGLTAFAFVIMPLFIFANAGMHIGSNFFSSLSNPVSPGVSPGLIFGNFISVFTFNPRK